MLTSERIAQEVRIPTRGFDEPLFRDRDGYHCWNEADREDGSGILLDLAPAFNTCQCAEYEVEENDMCPSCGTTSILGF